MTAARKKAAETMARTDVVIEVVDARCPAAGTNPLVHELRAFRQRSCLKVMSKADLADPQATKAWLAYFQRQPGVLAVALNASKAGEAAQVIGLARRLAPHRDKPGKPLRLMIMGIPNAGKSTLMNALAKRKVAAVADEPAVTKSQQRIELGGGIVLVDTPGLMWPKIEHDEVGYMLAACHAIGRNAVIEQEIASYLAAILLARYPAVLKARYGFAAQGLDATGVLEAVARKRGCIVPGRPGAWDLDRAAMLLLTDFRSGVLGRISLELPGKICEML